LAKGQNSAALSGRFISWPDRRCQRLLSTNRRIVRENLARPESLDFYGLYAALEPQYCDVLAVLSVESSDAMGAAGDFLPGIGDLKEPVAFSLRPWKHRET
jgi:hypothetical protein